jgi:hypothetical protein
LKGVILEEKIYEDHLQSIENELQKKKEHQNKKMANSSRNKKEKSSNRIEKIKINSKGFYFGFCKVMFYFSLIFFFILIIQGFYFILLYPKSVRVGNLIEVYVLGVETWDSFASVHTYCFETILWNNTALGWDGGTTLDTYRAMMEHSKSYVLDNYTRTLQYDLGNITEEYRFALNKVISFFPYIFFPLFFFVNFVREIHVRRFLTMVTMKTKYQYASSIMMGSSLTTS